MNALSPSLAAGWGDKVRRSFWRRLLRVRFRLFQRHRYDRLVLEWIAGKPMLVLPEVLNPGLFAPSQFLVEKLSPALVPPGSIVLDMGTGSGVGAVCAAQWARRVVAVDINPAAVRCARINALLNRVEEKVDVRQGDLFAPIQDERFDVVLFNPPFHRGAPRSALDHAWRSLDVAERFAAGLRAHLAPGGCALVVLSSDGETDSFLEAFRASQLKVDLIDRRDRVNEIVTLYRLV